MSMKRRSFLELLALLIAGTAFLEEGEAREPDLEPCPHCDDVVYLPCPFCRPDVHREVAEDHGFEPITEPPFDAADVTWDDLPEARDGKRFIFPVGGFDSGGSA